ncbi:MAG: peptidase M22 [Clostridia bacterium]|nr:peptidase M22 [Clostridia bacterium]MBO5913338.1 peptidase M22 [Clostridia bacterium]
MGRYLGIDTSNYTTSAARFDSESRDFVNSRRLLPVEKGSIGLRQSDALFHHTKALPEIISAACDGSYIDAIGVSDKPRAVEGSYMPCFLAGVSAASAIASATGTKLYKFSHQAGHIAAALFSANKLDLIGQRFISFHISGGTTEALLTEYDKNDFFKTTLVAKSLDLKMGQAVDRVGVLLGMSFPAGKELDVLSQNGSWNKKIRISVKGADCSISGLENKAKELLSSGVPHEDIAFFTIKYLCETVDSMTSSLKEEYGNLPFVFAGGVMSNSYIRKVITEKHGAFFASAQLSSDNAVGTAVMTSILHES